ncbi:MAG: EthD domain-containing protein [Novosphingobium sp.]
MDRVFVLLKRKPGMTLEDFRTHYEGSHAKLGEKYFGHLFASYRRNYIPEGRRFEDGSTGENAYDCLTELVFREPGGYQELRRIASDPEINKILKEDEAKFLDRTICANAPSQPIESDCSRFHTA